MENKKSITCKTCGEEIAKSAKACPKCGAKVKKPFYKKKSFYFLIILVVAIAALVFRINYKKPIEIGQQIESRNGNITITRADVGYRTYRKDFGTQFLVPPSLTDDKDVIVVDATIENAGKDDFSVDEDWFVINYDNGATYKGQGYYLTKDGKWTEYETLRFEKLTGAAAKIRIFFYVPKEVVDNEKSLKLEVSVRHVDDYILNLR